MASLNPFDLLGDDDNDDPSQLIASVQLKVEKEKPKAAADKAQPANNKLGGKQQPAAPAKSVKPNHSARNEGAGRSGPRGPRGDQSGNPGRSYGSGEGRGGYRGGEGRRDYNNEFESGNSNGYGHKPAVDGESGRPTERRTVGGTRSGPGGGGGGRGPRRGDEARPYDRHSRTGRGSEMKRNGAGSGNWGKEDELVPIEENAPVENDVNATSEKQQPDAEGDAADANKDTPPKEEDPEEKEMTLDEYQKVFEEKRKALLSLKTAEERKVDAKAFAAMQQLSCKKENDEIFAKLGADKEKKREAAEREEKAKKAVSINEFLKPAEGETYRGARGGRGRGRGGRGGNDRGGYGGGGYGRDVSAPSIEDPGQFPSLGGGK